MSYWLKERLQTMSIIHSYELCCQLIMSKVSPLALRASLPVGKKPKDTGFFCHYTSNNTEKPLTVKLGLFAAMAALNTESVLSQRTLCFE